jgi:hypothetical protein
MSNETDKSVPGVGVNLPGGGKVSMWKFDNGFQLELMNPNGVVTALNLSIDAMNSIAGLYMRSVGTEMLVLEGSNLVLYPADSDPIDPECTSPNGHAWMSFGGTRYEHFTRCGHEHKKAKA